jgi:hypothetical protein
VTKNEVIEIASTMNCNQEKQQQEILTKSELSCETISFPEVAERLKRIFDKARKFKVITYASISSLCKGEDVIVYLPIDNISCFDFKRKRCNHNSSSTIFFSCIYRNLKVCTTCETLIDDNIGFAFFGTHNSIYSLFKSLISTSRQVKRSKP